VLCEGLQRGLRLRRGVERDKQHGKADKNPAIDNTPHG
jgi:hypothetical protein